MIGEVGQHIASALDVDQLLEQMARLIQRSFGYYHVGIGLIEGGEVSPKAEVGAYAKAYRSIRIKLGQGDWGWWRHMGNPACQRTFLKIWTSTQPQARRRSFICVSRSNPRMK